MDKPIPKSESNGHSQNAATVNRLGDIAADTEATSELVRCLETEIGLLRTDYINRIAGMLKAIAAVERNSDKLLEAAESIESLNGLKSCELIEKYRRVSAGFRSAFPTSFGLEPGSSNRKSRLKNPEVFK